MGGAKYKTNDDEKYIDITKRSRLPIQMFIGARGTGKSFSVLRDNLDNCETNHKLLYIRNTEREAQIATSEIGNAFKALNRAFNTDIVGMFSDKLGIGAFYDKKALKGDKIKQSDYFKNNMKYVIGYSVGLSTIASARSIDLSDVDKIVFDEFIPERHVKKMRDRGAAFVNFLETVVRNRESSGKKFPTTYLLANAISLDDEIIEAFGIANDIVAMRSNSETRRTIKDKQVYIELIGDVEILKEKQNHTLYRAVNKEYADDALTADFHNERLDLIQKKFNRRDYNIVLSYGDIALYKKKTDNTWYFALNGERAKKHLLQTEGALLRKYMRSEYILELGKNRITFDNFTTRKIIEDALKLN